MDKQEFQELKSKFEKESYRKKTIVNLFNYGSTLAAAAALTILLSKSFSDDYFSVAPIPTRLTKNIESLEYQVRILEKELKKSKMINDSLLKLKNPEKQTIVNLKNLEIESRMENLERVISDNPEKAISIPLLKVELEHLKEQNEKDVKSMREEIARSYDTNKWIVGLVCTMLVSIIALNISNLLAKTKKE